MRSCRIPFLFPELPVLTVINPHTGDMILYSVFMSGVQLSCESLRTAGGLDGQTAYTGRYGDRYKKRHTEKDG